MAVRVLIAATLALALAGAAGCRSSVTGTFAVDGQQDWQFAETTCKLKVDSDGNATLDLFQYDTSDDTELVLDADDVMVRIPGANVLVRLTAADCSTYDVDLGDYTKVQGVKRAIGHVNLNCNRVELGHIVGNAKFTCYE